MLFFFWGQRLEAQSIASNEITNNDGAVLSSSAYRLVGRVGQPIVGVVKNSSTTCSLGSLYTASQFLSSEVEQTPSSSLPTEYGLEQNYPNPFNPSTTIRFSLPKQSFVTLKLFDILGREVAILVDEEMPPGNHKAIFETKGLPTGVYFYQLHADSFVQQRKLTVLK